MAKFTTTVPTPSKKTRNKWWCMLCNNQVRYREYFCRSCQERMKDNDVPGARD